MHFFYKIRPRLYAGYGVLLAADECSDTLITHPLLTPLHIRGQLILIMFRGSMYIDVVNIAICCQTPNFIMYNLNIL